MQLQMNITKWANVVPIGKIGTLRINFYFPIKYLKMKGKKGLMNYEAVPNFNFFHNFWHKNNTVKQKKN